MEENQNFEAWYELNNDHLPEGLRKIMDKSYETLRFIADDYRKGMEIIGKAVYELLCEHYPVFKKENRPVALARIKQLAENISYSLIVNSYKILNQQKAGMDFRKAYPKFEEYIKLYGSPDPPPELLTDANRQDYAYLDDTEWAEMKEDENKTVLEFFNWEQKRISEFMGLCQTLLFKLYKELEILDPDPLILFAGNIQEEYETFRISGEHIERVIDFGFPAEYLNLSYEEYLKKVEELPREKRTEVYNLKDRRIAGENI